MILPPDEPYVNYSLMKDIRTARAAGLIHPNTSLEDSREQNHLSELERRLRALDEVENYIAVKTLVKYHKKIFLKILEYMNEEGEKK